MTVRSLRNFLPVLRPEIPQHQVRPFGNGELGKPIDSAVFPNPVSGFHVVRVHLLGESRADGLFSREESLLRFGDFVKSTGRLSVESRFAVSRFLKASKQGAPGRILGINVTIPQINWRNVY